MKAVAGCWLLVACHQWYCCCCNMILDIRFSILDYECQKVLVFIEYPVSRIEYQKA
jgi:hypothetical protein